MNDNWNFLLSEFRRLGGIAENICQKEGEYGRGIFPLNPSLKVRIFTPSKLLIKKDDIYLIDNKLRIKKDKKYNQEIINFFNFYQDNFSWGFGGKETTEIFEKGLSLFNSNLKKLIKENALVDLEERHKGDWGNVIKTQFLNARAVKFSGTWVIAPIWELVNHKVKSIPFVINQKGVSTPIYPSTEYEIRHSYNNTSPLQRFFSHGFYSEETIVFSVPFQIFIKDLGLNICCKGINLNDDTIRIERSNDEIILEGLPIADSNHPKLPYYYFDEFLRKINDVNVPKDFLLKILKYNISIREKIIDESNLIDNQASKILNKLMNYEISLISFHN